MGAGWSHHAGGACRSSWTLWPCLAAWACGTISTGQALRTNWPLGTIGARVAFLAGRARFTGRAFRADQATVRADPFTKFIDDQTAIDANRAWCDVAVDLFSFAGLQGKRNAGGGNRHPWGHFVITVDSKPQFYLIAVKEISGERVAVAAQCHAVASLINGNGKSFCPENGAETLGVGCCPACVLVVRCPPGKIIKGGNHVHGGMQRALGVLVDQISLDNQTGGCFCISGGVNEKNGQQ